MSIFEKKNPLNRLLGFLIISKNSFLKEVQNNILGLGYLIIITAHIDFLFYKKLIKIEFKILLNLDLNCFKLPQKL